MCKMVVYHHNDLDGRCAAAIMYLFARNKGFSAIQFREVDYKDSVDFSEIGREDTASVVDFSFKPEVMADLCRRALSVIWCDHHATAKDYPYTDLPGFRDFSNKGLSGCECTWRHCFGAAILPPAVRLIGDYDAWRLDEKPLCFEFYEGMKLEGNQPPDSPFWEELITRHSLQRVQAIAAQGAAAIKYRDVYCAELAKAFGYETEINGHKAYAMNLYRFGSKQFGDRFAEYPVCIAYIHDGRRFTVSLYSETVDVSVIAKFFGGGGHKGAAGFVCKELPFMRQG